TSPHAVCWKAEIVVRGRHQMNKSIVAIGLAVALLSPFETALAEEKEPLAVLGFGLAGDWGVPGGKFSRGPSAAIEFNVIKDWLEIELGTARLFRRGHTEWESEIVFRKPFDLSDTVEMMIGLGPKWNYHKGEGTRIGTTFALDFMFWSS